MLFAAVWIIQQKFEQFISLFKTLCPISIPIAVKSYYFCFCNLIVISNCEVIFQRCAKRVIEHDAPITRYYERLAAVQQRGSQASHQVLRDLLKDIMTNQVPRTILKEWAMHTFQDATDYWTFRSTVSERDGHSHCSYRAIPYAIFFPGLFSLLLSQICSLMVVWDFGVGVLDWVFGVLYINIKQ